MYELGWLVGRRNSEYATEFAFLGDLANPLANRAQS